MNRETLLQLNWLDWCAAMALSNTHQKVNLSTEASFAMMADGKTD
ncbi:hypothetical protein [Mesorhizobium sp. 113-1-2]|nr:hypothetical protein [Mesorhizobium sp. 113-1-2]